MSALTLPAEATANERLKEAFGPVLAASLAAAVALHVLLFALWPTMRAATWAGEVGTTTRVVQVATTDVPPTPKALPRPASPRSPPP